MPRVGYARVSSTGQSLEVQLEKLDQAKCDRIYQEKRSGRTADRPEFKFCMNYLREGDTLIITRLDRLARSVVHLAQLAKRFQNESRPTGSRSKHRYQYLHWQAHVQYAGGDCRV